jgi:hypothetical protein
MMIIEYSVEDLRNYYDDALDTNDQYENLETILSNKIDEDNINSDILHIFPITLSSTIILFLSLYYFI